MGWLPPYLRSSGACLGSRHEGLFQPLNAGEDYAIPGLRLFCCGELSKVLHLHYGPTRPSLSLVRHLHLSGDGPHEGRHFPRDRDHDLVSVLATGDQAAVTFAEAYLGFPTDILDRLGHLL